jgi:hypothetical protein
MTDPLHEALEMLSFTEAETEALVMALARGQTPFNIHDATVVLEWAQETRLRGVLLSLALQGKIGLSLHNGEVQACPPSRPRDPHIRSIK